MNAIKDLLQRIRNDRAKQQGTWIGVDESHIILNALEKSERIEAENAEVRKQAVQEFVEGFKSRYFFMMATYMKNPIYQCTGDELDRLVKEVCGE